MDIVMQLFAFIVTILVLVSFHEAGHFLVAKLLGIKVLRFSIGFGKALTRFRDRQGTEYVLALIPLGGYVKLLDEREVIVPEREKHLAFNRQPLWARTLVVLAGPITNIIFAVLAFWIMFMVGIESYRPIIGVVEPNSIAAKAGLQPNDEIQKIDGHSVPSLQKAVMAIVMRLGEKTSLTIKTTNMKSHQTATHLLDLSHWSIDDLNPDPLTSLGIEPVRPAIPAVIHRVEQQSPAFKAGLKPHDRILAIDGKPIRDWYQLISYIRLHPGKLVTFTYQNQGKIQTVTIPIERRFSVGFKSTGYLGVQPMPMKMPPNLLLERKYPFAKAFQVSLQETWQFVIFNFVILKKMLLGQVSVSSLGGPITIFQTADDALRQGVTVFLGFLALISVMLAFINILPIPGLDGGHLLNYLIEFVMRRPLPLKYEILAMQIGMFLLILIMLLATFNDISRLIIAIRQP